MLNAASPARARSQWATTIVGCLIGMIGLALAIGGSWLLILGGSPYYLTTGVAMIASGFDR